MGMEHRAWMTAWPNPSVLNDYYKACMSDIRTTFILVPFLSYCSPASSECPMQWRILGL